jgi:hypothetical protein
MSEIADLIAGGIRQLALSFLTPRRPPRRPYDLTGSGSL